MRLPIVDGPWPSLVLTVALLAGGSAVAAAQGMQFGQEPALVEDAPHSGAVPGADPVATLGPDGTAPIPGGEAGSLISGNTLTGWRNGSPFTEFYDEDGSIRGTSNNAFYLGSWSLDDDMICVDYEFGDITDYDACAASVLPREGELVFQDDAGADIQTFELKIGNPEDL